LALGGSTLIDYKKLFEEEREDRRRIQEILFEKLGVIAESRREEVNIEGMKPVQRFHTLSSIRRKAEEEARKAAGVAVGDEMTEAERLFQENLNWANRKESR